LGPQIPAFDAWLSYEDLWWISYPLPKDNCGIILQRIPPLPPAIYQALNDVYGLSEVYGTVCKTGSSKDYLVHVLLGERKEVKNEYLRPRNLRDFYLYVNEIEGFGLDTDHFACIMARALAVLHWCAGVDGRGIKFVLGLEASDEAQEATAGLTRRAVRVWMIDFDQCSRYILLDVHKDEWLSLLCGSFWANGSYLPRPGSGHPADQQLWVVFARQYLQASHEVLKDSAMPDLFISALEAEGRQRQIGLAMNGSHRPEAQDTRGCQTQ
jgi:hypothetical protein